MQQPLQITRRLRRLGYPAPEFIVAGSGNGLRYLVQRMLPGRACAALTPDLLERVVELNRLQDQAASEFRDGWPTLETCLGCTQFRGFSLDPTGKDSFVSCGRVEEIARPLPKDAADF